MPIGHSSSPDLDLLSMSLTWNAADEQRGKNGQTRHAISPSSPCVAVLMRALAKRSLRRRPELRGRPGYWSAPDVREEGLGSRTVAYGAIRKPSSRRRYWNACSSGELTEEQEIVSCVKRVTVTPIITERAPTNVGQLLGNF